MPPYPREAMAHLASPAGAGPMDAPDATGESGAASCGDVVRIQLRIAGGRVREARFLAFGCGAATAAASAACARLDGAPLDDALRLDAATLDRDLGGLGAARRHGPELVEDAVARALEQWYSARLGATGLPLARGRVVVGMSGGVDSAVAAMLLRDAGYDVVGVTMRLWHDPSAVAAERSCCSPETVRLARASAHALGIPHLTIDAVETFRRGVVDAFAQGYRAGLTPNPCVTCNGEVRFRVLAQAAALLGARRLATGHYARVAPAAGGTAVIARAAHADKDQSYMLARLGGRLLERCAFPLGELRKDEVRAMAAAAGLPAAQAVESQEVCFVGESGYVPFLERTYGMRPAPGPVVDPAGRILGEHAGYWRYTVGQRRGLGIAASDGPLYVLRADRDTNTVVVGPREGLAVHRILLDDAVVHEPLDEGPVEVRVRYRGRPLRGIVARRGGRLALTLEDPADGVAPGQTAALYRQGRLVAGGTIAGSTDVEV
ncbi:MAG: tRNA 2-thiouridine(34) synthase MnmA [Actinomycetota bacterium]